MSIYLSKASLNEKSALLLQNNSYYAPSVHCSYYRCVQIMLHIMNHILNIEKGNYDSQSLAEKISSHSYVIKQIHKNIKYRIESSPRLEQGTLYGLLKKFNQINELKEHRVVSDYHEEEVELTQCDKAIKFADEISVALNKIYQL